MRFHLLDHDNVIEVSHILNLRRPIPCAKNTSSSLEDYEDNPTG